MSRYLSAELLRSRHTALQWLPLTALPLVGLTYNLAAFVNSRTDAVGVLMWQAVYLTGIAAPLTALFAAAAENREKKSNYGGTLWLPLSRKRLRATRLGVILLSLAIFHVLNFGGTWLLLTLSGRSGSERIAVLGLYAYIGTIGIAGLASALTRLTNFLITFLVFTAWQIVGITKPLVEGDHWWIWPMTWPVRLVLPILGVHQNAVPLEPGSPLNKESPAGALILCGVLALLGIIAATLTPESWQVQKKKSPTVSPSTALKSAQFRPALLQRTAARKPRPYSALTLAALTPTVRACLLLSIAALILCTLIYPISYIHGLFSFAILPVGAGILPVLVWPQLDRCWAVMRTEHFTIARDLLLWCGACVLIVNICATACGVLMGNQLLDELRRLFIGTLVGYVIVLLSVQSLRRVGTSATMIGVIILTVFSATLGGDVLADTPLWVVAFPAWPETAETPLRVSVAMASSFLAIGGLQQPTKRLLNRQL